MTRGLMMTRGLILTAVAALLGGCSWLPALPFTGGNSGGPPVTNEAVDACKRQARADGFDNVGQQQVTPAGDGRYVVVFAAVDNLGSVRTTCTYDPAAGVKLDPAPRKG